MFVIREDYHKYTMLSYKEAANYAGVSVATICKWVSSGRLPVAYRRGTFRIDFLVLKKFLRKEI